MNNKRQDKPTIPVSPLPSSKDPIWTLGHKTVALLHDYLNDVTPKSGRPQGIIQTR